ncbi:MAG: hypothetical protein Q9223_005427 [Gallowayella weberi]
MEYLLPVAQLLFTRQSFDRLFKVSQHPILGRCVKSLVYRVDLLRQHFDKDEYVRGLAREMSLNVFNTGPEWAGPKPPPHASDRDWRLYERNRLRATNPKVRYTARQLSLGWVAYEKLWLEQKHLRDASYGEKEIMATLAHFPNLKHITLSNFHDACEESAYFEATYKHTLMPVSGDEGYGESSGMPQLLSLIRALDRTSTVLESLKAGLVSWHVLDAEDEDFELMKNVFHALKSLTMGFQINQEYEWQDPDEHRFDRDGEDEEECQDFLAQGRHLELLRSMPNLCVVDLAFHSYDLYFFDIEPVYKDIHWSHLRDLSLSFYRGTDQNLLDVLQRHAGTLKILRLSNYSLAKGLWLHTFREIRTSLKLEQVELKGWLQNEEYHPKDSWDVTNWSLDEAPSQKDNIESYVLGSEAVALKHIIGHGANCCCQGGPYHDLHNDLWETCCSHPT